MNRSISTILVMCLSSCFCFNTNAQDTLLTKEYKKEVVENLSNLMNDFYVFPEIAKQTEIHIKNQLEDGYFNAFDSIESFAEALTESVQFVNHDKHMRIKKNRPREAAPNTPEALIEDRIYHINRQRNFTGGFYSVSKMGGNVGYLDLRGFHNYETGRLFADNYMKLLSTSDAIIIDLRKNGGGDPRMVQYLCSYFFGKKIHLNSLYFREGNETIDYWTQDKIGGEKMPDVPLFVLTSNFTFSGAEEFSYNMQTQERATLVGQTTGGGANPGRSIPLNGELNVFIPNGMAINPITKTNWEGVGVIPDYQTEEEEETLNKAHELAKVAAEKYRTSSNERYKALFTKLNKTLKNYDTSPIENNIFVQIKSCQEAGLLEEWMINIMGYDYLMDHNKPNTAIAIFEANVALFPNSANCYDSYAEALAMNGALEKSKSNYQKAIDIAIETGDPQLKLYEENLQKIITQLKDRE